MHTQNVILRIPVIVLIILENKNFPLYERADLQLSTRISTIWRMFSTLYFRC